MATATARFEALPVEVVRNILPHVPDIQSLHGLALASPKAFSVLGRFGTEVIEKVLCRYFARDVLLIVRCVARVRRSTAADPAEKSGDVPGFLRRHLQYVPAMSDWTCFAGLVRDGLNDDPNAFSPFGLLALARRIASRAEECLREARERFLAAKHLKPAERRVIYGVRPWSQRFEGVPYTPEDRGSPSWLEMQRMMRGFWHLQLIYEMEAATGSGRLTGDRESPPLLEIESLCVGRLVRQFNELNELVMAMEFGQGKGAAADMRDLQSLREAVELQSSSLQNSGAPSRQDESCWLDSVFFPPRPNTNPSTPGTKGNRSLEFASRMRARRGLLNRRRVAGPMGFRAAMEHEGLSHAAYGLQVSNRLSTFCKSPLFRVPTEEFRNLGLFIWDAERLVASGLLSSPEPTGTYGLGDDEDNLTFTWRSLLNDDVIAEAEATADREWRQYARSRQSQRRPLTKNEEEASLAAPGIDWYRWARCRAAGTMMHPINDM